MRARFTWRAIAASWLPVILWMSAIFYVSSFPTAKASAIHWEDFSIKKLAHVIEYGALALLSFRALRRSGYSRKQSGIGAVLIVFVYGCSDEIHQSFVPGREPRFRDVLIDTFGASLAMISIWKLLPKAPPRLRSWAKKLELC